MLQLAGCGVLFLTLSGCVTKSRYQRDIVVAYEQGRKDHADLIETLDKSMQLQAERPRNHVACPQDGRHQLVNGVCVDLEGK